MATLSLMVSAAVIDGTIQRKMCERGVARAGKGITLTVSTKSNDGFHKIIKSLENSGVLFDGSSKTGKHEIKRNKRTRRRIFWYAVKNFRCFNVRKCVNWEGCNESWKKSHKSKKRIEYGSYG